MTNSEKKKDIGIIVFGTLMLLIVVVVLGFCIFLAGRLTM